MVLCETWLKSRDANRLLVFPGFTLRRYDRKFSPLGYGGVAVLFRDDLDAKKINVPVSLNKLCKLESLWNVFSWERNKVVVGAVYRSPRHKADALEADFEELERQYQHVLLHFPDYVTVITGDLNCNMLGDVDSPARSKLSEFLATYSLTQTVSQPTYSSGSLLDVFIINRDFNQRTGTHHCHFNPHKFIRMSCKLPKLRRKPVVVRARVLRRIDTDAYHRDLSAVDWTPVFTAESVADKWDGFASLLRRVVDRHAPFKYLKIRNPTAPAITETTRDLITPCNKKKKNICSWLEIILFLSLRSQKKNVIRPLKVWVCKNYTIYMQILVFTCKMH